jgi:hypothetical protein
MIPYAHVRMDLIELFLNNENEKWDADFRRFTLIFVKYLRESALICVPYLSCAYSGTSLMSSKEVQHAEH